MDTLIRERVEQSFNQQQFMHFIGAAITDAGHGYCEITVPYSIDLTQQNGYFHAGIIGTLADNAAGYAAYSMMSERSSVLTVEYKLNLLRPGDGECLIAQASVIKKGKTLTVCRSDVYVLKNGIEYQCAAAIVTVIELLRESEK